ncbi:cleavage factor two protein 2 [[Candida] railenensis]|uniref:Cleavage and polyadenylation specificity factor subunit 2 n=1 Tax=[Candida] railenensis TaxID=45579 RepID=A0A9P0VXN9_9ASCO|nr:cleavage factor two protein 2 [[Candida] railenensis]
MFTFSLLENESSSCRVSKLTFDSDIVILADPSWDGKDHNDILFMEPHLRNVDFIILSHGTPEFISGFILLCIKFPNLMNNIKIYSTVPVNQLGRISTVEFYRSKGIVGPLKDAILEVSEIDEWFDKISELKFFQTLSLLDNKLVITPYNAGHTLGGTFWLLTKKLEKVIYAPAWNHSKDSFLNAASFLASSGSPLAQLIRPTVLITNTDLGSSMSHRKRTEKFLQLVDATLANGGSVLLPTSLSGRFLEILHLIDQHLQSAPIPVLFLSYSGTKALSYASNLLEWMSSQLIKEWEDSQSHGGSNNKNNIPFDPSKVDLLSDPSELVQLTGPKIVFCTGLDLTNGDMSVEALQYLCNDEKTTIILTEKSKFSGSLNEGLYSEWYNLAKGRVSNKDGIVEDGIAVPLEKLLTIDNFFRTEQLVGEELKDFNENIAKRRRENLLAKVRDKRNKNLLNTDAFSDDSSDDDDDDDDDEDDDEGEEGEEESDKNGTGKVGVDKAAATEAVKPEATAAPVEPAATEADLAETLLADYIKTTLTSNKPLDIRITHKIRPRQAMFPFVPNTHRQKFDDYGEIIDIKMFQKVEDHTQKRFIIEKRGGQRNYNNNNQENGFGNNGKQSLAPRITPQETLNNQVLQKNLDTLFAPSKRVYQSNSKRELRVRCGLSFVDLSGLVDLRSLSLIVSLIKPYNLVLLPDDTAPIDSEINQFNKVKTMFEQQQSNKKEQQFKKQVVNSARYMSLTNIRGGLSGLSSSKLSNNSMNIVAPVANESIRIGYDDEEVGGIGLTNFEIKLDDAILENLSWQKIDGSYKVAQVYGELEISNPSTQADQDKAIKKQKTAADFMNNSTQFTLKPLSKKDFQQKSLQAAATKTDTAAGEFSTTGSSVSNPKLAIGNIRLTELKKKLLEKNLNVEFKSEGTLVVNEELAIRKVTYGSGESDDTGDIVIDGQMGSLYFQVRDCIREMLAYV